MEKIVKATATFSIEIEAVSELKSVVALLAELLKKELCSVFEEKTHSKE